MASWLQNWKSKPTFLDIVVTKPQGHIIKILLEGEFNKQVLGMWFCGVTGFHFLEEVEPCCFIGQF